MIGWPLKGDTDGWEDGEKHPPSQGEWCAHEVLGRSGGKARRRGGEQGDVGREVGIVVRRLVCLTFQLGVQRPCGLVGHGLGQQIDFVECELGVMGAEPVEAVGLEEAIEELGRVTRIAAVAVGAVVQQQVQLGGHGGRGKPDLLSRRLDGPVGPRRLGRKGFVACHDRRWCHSRSDFSRLW